MDIDAVYLDVGNVRKHDKINLDAIKGSLQRFGMQKPIVIDEKNIVRAGNGTLLAAKELGWKTIAVVRSTLKDIEMVAYAAADNRTAELASWDEPALSEILQQLKLDDFPLDSIGFDEEYLASIKPPMEGNTDEDEVPEVDEKDIRVKDRDLFQLGEHRVLCGDCTVKDNVDRLMDGEKADMVFTDPPYGIGLDYNTYDDSEQKWFGLINKVMPILKQADFIILPCCRIKALHWWYANHKPDWIMCWYKGSPGHRSHIGFNDWEPHLVWGKPKNTMHDYWQTKCGFEIDGHPCPKPVEYCEWIVSRAINTKDIVLDVFLGSGTNLIACEKTHRKCYGCEIDPYYVQVILKRWEDFTGKKAVKINA